MKEKIKNFVANAIQSDMDILIFLGFALQYLGVTTTPENVAEVIADKLCRSFCHIHGLIFKAFTNLERTSSAVNRRAYSYNGIIAYKSGFCHFLFPFNALRQLF